MTCYSEKQLWGTVPGFFKLIFFRVSFVCYVPGIVFAYCMMFPLNLLMLRQLSVCVGLPNHYWSVWRELTSSQSLYSIWATCFFQEPQNEGWIFPELPIFCVLWRSDGGGCHEGAQLTAWPANKANYIVCGPVQNEMWGLNSGKMYHYRYQNINLFFFKIFLLLIKPNMSNSGKWVTT